MAKTKTSRAKDMASSVGSNDYVRRLVEDGDLRDNLRDAYLAGMAAYGRLSRKKAPAKALMDDKKIHRELKDATESLREATDRLRGKKRKRRWPKVLLFGVVGAGVALAVSEDLRKKVLDKVFGAEEEFEYTSTTTPAPSADGDGSDEA